MRLSCAVLLLLLVISPVQARPFDYNVSYGPEYVYFNSHQAGTNSQLVTCGITCSGNLFDRLNAEFRGGTGEISTTRISYNELALLYDLVKSADSFQGVGLTLMNYENILDKTGNVAIRSQQLNLKVKWAQVFGPIWGLYFNAAGPSTLSYDLGWLAYWDEYFGDFNLRLGYKNIGFEDGSSMRGPYIASSIYF